MTYACEPYVPPTSRMCGETHCTRLADTSEDSAWCKCLDWQNKPIPGCEPKSSTTPIKSYSCYNQATKEQRNISQDACQDLRDKDRNWKWEACYCCCSCFAWDTRIRVPEEETRFIQEIEEKDDVLAAWVKTDGAGKLEVTWKPRKVSYSDGTLPTAEPQTMMVVQYGDAGEVTVNLDQLFLIPNGKLKEARYLKPGEYLVDDLGQPVKIKGVYLGEYIGGIHHLGLGDVPKDTNVPINGNLFSANGVIVGDFWLQVTYAGGDTKAENGVVAAGRADMHVLGSQAYAELSDIEADLFSARLKGTEPEPIQNLNFLPYTAQDRNKIPADAMPYLSEARARAIATAPHYPVSMDMNRSDFSWLKAQFEAFFPSVNIYLEWADELPNLYAFEQFGQRIIYVSGRILRTKGMYWQGLAVIISHGIADFYASGEEEGGYPCQAVADNFGIGYVMRTLFDPNWGEAANEGLLQIKEFFSHIPKRLRPGDPNDRCRDPGVDCRLEALEAAIIARPLPACTGIPQPGRLELRRAMVEEVDDTPAILVTFNEAVGESAENVTNYTILPAVEITSAKRDSEDESKVVLTVIFPDPAEGQYELTVHDILAADGSTLSSVGRTVYFEVKAP